LVLPKRKDWTGQKYNRLTFIQKTQKKKRESILWLCKCQCGNFIEVIPSMVSIGNTKSCGCLRKELAKINLDATAHGMQKTRQYAIWCGIKKRCLNEDSDTYNYYGGRGIKICDKWLTFEGFWEDMKQNYSDDLTIDRINVDGDYCKENCRWATRRDQMNNTRRNLVYTVDGITATLKQHCERLQVKYGLVYNRIRRKNWEPEKALKTPVNKKYLIKTS
jgi:hypothetical protein